MNGDFEKDLRRQQEIRCRPSADEIYKGVFGDSVKIKRYERAEEFMLDKIFAMDVQLTTPRGLILTGQEKFLSAQFSKYKSVTVELLQDPKTGEQGDWYKMAVQFYFVGYEFVKTFKPWILLDWAAVVIATNENKIVWHDNINKDGHARASFRWAAMDNFPANCVIARSL